MINSPTDGTEPPCNGKEVSNHPNDEHRALLSLVVGSVDKPTCTIYPPDVATPHRSTVWISATGDAFVDLDHCQ